MGAHFEALDEGVLLVPLDPRYIQVGCNFFSVQVCPVAGVRSVMSFKSGSFIDKDKSNHAAIFHSISWFRDALSLFTFWFRSLKS